MSHVVFCRRFFLSFGDAEKRLTGIASDPEVPAGVPAEVVVGEVTLHSHLEAVDVGVVGDELVWWCLVVSSTFRLHHESWKLKLTAYLLRRAPSSTSIRQIPAQAPLVQTQPIGLGVLRQAVE